MTAPPAMMIEMAQDCLKDAEYVAKDADMRQRQAHELLFAIPDASADFAKGYALGIEVARVTLKGMPNAVFNGVEI